ncbi:MAG: ABC transporter substrate-binding protein, partial [Kamptonema sp. SIO4C4]|nr:ABC transporter substrate-binding protein [Kamptonema sp. SIO4C4]
FKLYAQALNQESQAQDILDEWQQRLDTFKAQLPQPAPTVSLVRFMPGITRLYYQNSFPGQIIQKAGLNRPKNQQKKGFADVISLENINIIDADIIFYFTYNETEKKGDETRNKWLSHPLWEQLEAVQNENTYAVSDSYWTTSSGVLAANKVLDDLSQYVLTQTAKRPKPAEVDFKKVTLIHSD